MKLYGEIAKQVFMNDFDFRHPNIPDTPKLNFQHFRKPFGRD
jgi:hypothetical protein